MRRSGTRSALAGARRFSMKRGHSTLPGLVAAAALLGCVAQTAQAGGDGDTPRYRVFNLGTLAPRSTSSAAAINDAGLIAGTMADGSTHTREVFLGTGRDDLRLLGTLGGGLSVATALNNRGEVVGWSTNADGVQRPVLYSRGSFTDLAGSFAGYTRGVANAVNAAGQVTGQINAHAFLYDGSRSRALVVGATSEGLGINDHGVVVGGAVMPGDVVRRPFLYDGGKTTLLPSLGGTFGQAMGINNAGQVVGYSYTAGGELLPFLYSGGKMTALADSGFGEALDINDKGWVVGSQNLSAFLWRDGVRRDLNDLVAPDQAGRWSLLSAQGINEAGAIVGFGLFHGYLRGFVATPVPEPGSWVLMLAGVGVVAATVRRRRAPGA
jgi:probable HAF family extracellular repeat protein